MDFRWMRLSIKLTLNFFGFNLGMLNCAAMTMNRGVQNKELSQNY